MKVAATEFRKNIFQLLESAINGEAVDVLHKGRTIHLQPEDVPSKLSRLSKRQVLADAPEQVDHALEGLNEQIRKDWELKWQ